MRGFAGAVALFLALAAPAAAQSGDPIDTVTVATDGAGNGQLVTGNADLVGGTEYILVATGQLTKTFFSTEPDTVIHYDTFHCFELGPYCNRDNSVGLIQATTATSPSHTPANPLAKYVMPDGKAPPYEGDHDYTVTVKFPFNGKLRVSTKGGCDGIDFECTGPGYTLRLYNKPAPPPPPPDPGPGPGSPPPPDPSASGEPPADPPSQAADQRNACAYGGTRAVAALKYCELGALPLGTDVDIAGRPGGRTIEFLAEPMPATTEEIRIALRDAILELEHEALLAAIALRLKQEPGLGDAFSGCVVVGSLGLVSARKHVEAVIEACKKIVLDAPAAKPAALGPVARIAAKGCSATFVPVYRKGRKVTQRQRKRAIAAAKRQLRVACTAGRGTLSATIRHRRKGKRLPLAANRKVGVSAAPTNKPGATPRLRVRVSATR